MYLCTIFLSCSEETKLEQKISTTEGITKRRSKIHEKNKLRERIVNFDQWNSFSGSYKPKRVWFWLVYKTTENNCRSRLFTEIMKTLLEKWSFLLRICSANVTKSTVCCGFGHIYWRNPWWKTSFFCTVNNIPNLQTTCHINSIFLLWTKFFFSCNLFWEADLGLLQHPRWSSLW